MKYIIILLINITLAFAISLPKNQAEWPVFFREMPKGGDLHYHFTGGVYPEDFVEIIKKTPYCLNKKTWQISDWSNACRGVNSAQWLNKKPNNYKKLVRAWSLSDFFPNNNLSPSDHFFKAFYLFGGIVKQHEAELLQTIIARALQQNILYLEIITVHNASNLPNFEDKLTVNNLASWAKQNNIAKLAKQIDLENQTLIDTALNKNKHKITILFQEAILREQPLKSFVPQAILAFAIANLQHSTVAINIVQPEQGYLALHDYHAHMQVIGLLHKLFPKARITLHAGELNHQIVTPRDLSFHINDALEIGNAERIGHGVDIAFENHALNTLQTMSKFKKAVEVNISSNQALLNTNRITHPLNLYLKHGVPVVLATDDEGILRTDLSHEYWLAASKFKLDYETIKKINRNSLTYAFIPGQSIWDNPDKNLLITACKNLQSKTCQEFTRINPKAKLQRDLELNLIKFEALYGAK